MLKLGVGGASSDVLSPCETPDGSFGNDTPEDENTSQVVEEDPKPSAVQQRRYSCY